MLKTMYRFGFWVLLIGLLLTAGKQPPTKHYLPLLNKGAYAGQGSITGRIISMTTPPEPVQYIIVWFCEVIRDPDGDPAGDVFVCDMAWSPTTRTDEHGVFERYLPPKEWVIVVSYGEFNHHQYDIIEEPGCSMISCTVRVFDLLAGDVHIDAGDLRTWIRNEPGYSGSVRGEGIWVEGLD